MRSTHVSRRRLPPLAPGRPNAGDVGRFETAGGQSRYGLAVDRRGNWPHRKIRLVEKKGVLRLV